MAESPQLLRSGKVRDIYRWQKEIWLVATDRISAYDVILPDSIPGKGTLLTSISQFWFASLPAAQPHHVLGFDVPSTVPQPEKYAGRLTRCRAATWRSRITRLRHAAAWQSCDPHPAQGSRRRHPAQYC